MEELKQPLVPAYRSPPPSPSPQRAGFGWRFYCHLFMFATLVFTFWPQALRVSVRDVTFLNSTGTLEKQAVFHNPNVYSWSAKAVHWEEYVWHCPPPSPCIWRRVGDTPIGDVVVPAMGSKQIALSTVVADVEPRLLFAFAASCLGDDLMLRYAATTTNHGDVTVLGETDVYRVICDLDHK